MAGDERRITIRVSQALYDRLVTIAEQEHRSLQGQIVHVLDRLAKEFDTGREAKMDGDRYARITAHEPHSP